MAIFQIIVLMKQIWQMHEVRTNQIRLPVYRNKNSQTTQTTQTTVMEVNEDFCWSQTNKVKKRTLFNKTRQYTIHIFDKIIFFKYRTKQIKTTKKEKMHD